MRTFRVRNWEELQHYRDRTPIWIKLYTRLLENYEFGRLPDASKAHLIAIWLLASRSKNELPYDAEWIGKRINATEVVDLDILLAFDFIFIDQEAPNSERHASKTVSSCLPRVEEKREEKEKKTLAPARENVSRENFQDDFDVWWQAYPVKRGRGHAWKAYKAARKKTDSQTLLDGAKRYAVDPSRKDEFTAYPSTWLNGERWLDSPAQSKDAGQAKTPEQLWALKVRLAKSAYAKQNPSLKQTPQDAKTMLENGEITPDEAAYSGYVGEKTQRETISPTEERAA